MFNTLLLVDSNLAPTLNTEQLHLSMYAFVGKLLGMSIRGKHALNLDWPSAVWKLLVGGAAAAGTAGSSTSSSSSSSSADSTTESDASAVSANGKNAASSSESSSSSSPMPNALSTFTVATVSTLDRADLEGCDVLCMTALNKISGLEAEFSGSGSGDATTSASASASSASASASASATSASASASASAADADDSGEPTEDAVTRASRALDELGYTFTTVSVDGRVVELVPGGARIRFATVCLLQRTGIQ
jgi:hypothetical protein